MKRQLLLVSLLTGLSQLAAFFKLWQTARFFGVGADIDGYYLALIAPTLASGVISGVIQTGLFPTRAKLATEQNKAEIERFEREVLWGVSCIGLLSAALIYFNAKPLAGLLLTSTPIATQSAFLSTVTICALLVWANIVSDCVGYLLAFRKKFALAAAAPIFNGAAGSLIIITWNDQGISTLIFSTMAGALIQLAICAAGLASIGFTFTASVKLANTAQNIWTILKTGGWILPGVIFSNFIVSLPPIWAAKYGEGAVSAFNYAYRMHSSIVQLLIMASSTILLARLSELWAAGDHATISRILRQSIYISIGIGASVTLTTWGIGANALELLFGGKFDAATAQRVANIWLYLSFGLGFVVLGNVISKLWQAQGRPKLMTVMAAVSLCMVIIFHTALGAVYGELSIPIALSLMAAANAIIGLRLLRTH